MINDDDHDNHDDLRDIDENDHEEDHSQWYWRQQWQGF